MNNKIKLTHSFSILFFFTTSCHFGFPDCEDDSNVSVLKWKIAGNEFDFDEIEIDNYEETGLSDMGLGSNSFTCECQARYKTAISKGTIKFSVTRSNGKFATRIIEARERGYHRIKRTGQVDSLVSINNLYKKGSEKPIESLYFNKNKPTIGQEYTLFINEEYSNYKLTSVIPLYEPGIPYDSTSALDKYRFSELLFEFRYKDKICFYASKLEKSPLEYFGTYSFRVNQRIEIENLDKTNEPAQFLTCISPPSFNKIDYIFLFNNGLPSPLTYDASNVIRVWKVEIGSDYNLETSHTYYYYYLNEENPEDIECNTLMK